MTQPIPPSPPLSSQHLRERINRRLETLADDRLYQVLDYVEFLESKYAQRQNPPPNPLQRLAEGVEDKLRAGRVSAATIAETMGLLNRAVGVLNGVAAAGKSVATDLASAAQRMGTAVTDVATGTPGSTGAAGAPPAPGAPSPTPAPGQAPPQQTPPSTTPPGEAP